MHKRFHGIGILGILFILGGSASADKVDEAAKKTEHAVKTVGEAGSDSWLTAKTKLALFADSRVSGSQINVETKDGTITLRGKVDTATAKAAAEDIANGIDGKKEVKDELQVVAPTKRKIVEAKDDYIVSTVSHKLAKEPLLKGTKIDVRSDNGVVTLSGDVPSVVVSAVASETAFRVNGVRYVKNTLTEKVK